MRASTNTGTPVRYHVAPLLFGSGLCALVYQIAWLREFRLIFGASTAASAAVLAIFIGGLGAGGLWLGRRADLHLRPLALYARLELTIAAAAATTPVLLWAVRKLYILLGGTPALGLGPGTAVRLVLAALVLAVPTVLMGGTLPAAGRAVETEDDPRRRGVGLLYGVNTLGAVTGSVLATFFLLELVGTRFTLWLACAANAAVALAAFALSRRIEGAARLARHPRPRDDTHASAPDTVTPSAPTPSAPTPSAPTPSAPTPSAPTPSAPASFVLAAAAGVGFAFFLMELVWYRLLGPLLGGTVFTFGLILATALLGIGLGGSLWAATSRDRPPTLAAFASTCLLEALLVLLPFAVGDRLAILAALLRPLGNLGFGGHVLAWSVVTSLVVLPAAFVSGVQFPLLIALLGRGRRHVGRQVGLAYAWNTAGAIAGSLAGGFGLLPLLGAPGCWRLVAGLLLLLGVFALALSGRLERRASALAGPAVIAALVGVLAFADGPTAAWRHSPIGSGRVTPDQLSTPNQIEAFVRQQRRGITWQAEGVESSVALDEDQATAFVVNGKVDGSARFDAPTQVMSGLVGALLHPAPRRALVIGLGTGSTAGWLAAVPTMERVDVVELEPAILEVARRCAAVNHDAMSDPKVVTAIGDAREVLLTTRARYDIVFSEPSNPYRAGIASLFTREFYRAVRARLTDGGVFLQWVQGYEIDGATLRSIYATLAAEFAHVETWRVQASDLLLVASATPLVYDVSRLRARVTTEPFASALAYTWRVAGAEGFLSRFVAGDPLARAVLAGEKGRTNTDDHNRVEFAFARSVGKKQNISFDEIASLARKLGADRPAISGDVDWKLVDRLSVGAGPSEGLDPGDDAAWSAEQRALARVLRQWVKGDFTAAAAGWAELGLVPASIVELAAVADGAAAAGDEGAALPLVERLRATHPAEADYVLARLRVRQGRLGDAEAALAAVFARLRRDPWILPLSAERALRLARELGAQDPGVAGRLFDALAVPFAVNLHHDLRLETRVFLAEHAGFAERCVEAFAPYEPHFPFRGDLLLKRWECYRATGHPATRRARRDLNRFSRRQGTPFRAGLEPSPGGAR